MLQIILPSQVGTGENKYCRGNTIHYSVFLISGQVHLIFSPENIFCRQPPQCRGWLLFRRITCSTINSDGMSLYFRHFATCHPYNLDIKPKSKVQDILTIKNYLRVNRKIFSFYLVDNICNSLKRQWYYYLDKYDWNQTGSTAPSWHSEEL